MTIKFVGSCVGDPVVDDVGIGVGFEVTPIVGPGV